MAEDPTRVPGVTPPDDDDDHSEDPRKAALDVGGTPDVSREPETETPPPSGGAVEQG
jgi:hypothetical protein